MSELLRDTVDVSKPVDGNGRAVALIPEAGDDGLYELKLSDKITVKIAELSGPETRLADSCASNANESNQMRALASVRFINTQPTGSPDPKNAEMAINRILGRLSGKEYDRLTLYYLAIFNDPELEDLAKTLPVRR